MTPDRKPLPVVNICPVEKAALIELLRAIREAVQEEAAVAPRAQRPTIVWERPPAPPLTQ
jgi:hypothetical protein